MALRRASSLGTPWMIVAAVITWIVLFLVATSFYRDRDLVQDTHKNPKAEVPAETYRLPKRILAWTSLWHEQSLNWEKIFYRQVSRECEESRCELVYDHRLLDTADAVIFHAVDLHPEYELPPYHNPEQIWIFLSLEAPPVMTEIQHVDLTRLKGVFNWTMTYRRDSDVVVPYGRVVPIKGSTTQQPPKNYWVNKTSTKFAAWMVSHCGTYSRREWFIRDLVNHMQLEVFGRCGNKKCGRNISIRTLGTYNQDECNAEIQEYLFYLAFENAICEDYVTEKFFLALTLDVIPVVFGGGNYDAVAPPNSYINALNFKTPKELATFLKLVAENETVYNKYMEWKQHYMVELGHPFSPMVCDLCLKLHDPSSYTPANVTRSTAEEAGVVVRGQGRDSSGTYPDIHGWFVEGSACRRWWKGPYDYRQHELIYS